MVCEIGIYLQVQIEADAADVYFLGGGGLADPVELPELDDIQVATLDSCLETYSRAVSQYEQGEYLAAYATFISICNWAAGRAPEGELRKLLSAAANNAGHSAEKVGHSELALRCFMNALEASDPEDYDDHGKILGNIGGAYLHLGEFELAERFHSEAYLIHASNSSDTSLVSASHSNLSFVFRAQAARYATNGEVTTAIVKARRAVALEEEYSAEGGGLNLSLTILANLLARKSHELHEAGSLSASEKVYSEAVHLYLRANAGQLALDGYTSLALMRRKLGLIEDAIEALRIVEELKETLARERSAIAEAGNMQP